MCEQSSAFTLDDLRHEMAEKSRQLSELDMMLAEYHRERRRLIHDLQRLQARLREAEEPLPPSRSSDE